VILSPATLAIGRNWNGLFGHHTGELNNVPSALKTRNLSSIPHSSVKVLIRQEKDVEEGRGGWSEENKSKLFSRFMLRERVVIASSLIRLSFFLSFFPPTAHDV